jgi:hypothetical protein
MHQLNQITSFSISDQNRRAGRLIPSILGEAANLSQPQPSTLSPAFVDSRQTLQFHQLRTSNRQSFNSTHNGLNRPIPRLARPLRSPLLHHIINPCLERNAPQHNRFRSISSHGSCRQLSCIPRHQILSSREIHRHRALGSWLTLPCRGFPTRCCWVGQRVSDSADLLSCFVLPDHRDTVGGGWEEA